jgi:hypothetical protein
MALAVACCGFFDAGLQVQELAMLRQPICDISIFALANLARPDLECRRPCAGHGGELAARAALLKGKWRAAVRDKRTAALSSCRARRSRSA